MQLSNSMRFCVGQKIRRAEVLFLKSRALYFRRMNSSSEPTIQYVSSSPGENVAYRHSPGKSPGIIFLPGFMSNMNGTKAVTLERYCREIGHSYVRFDYRGHGMSSGNSQSCTIGMRKEDVLAILDQVVQGPQILVGSSMGGWIMLLVAVARKERICGLVGVASAVDFLSRRYSNLPDNIKTEVKSTGKLVIPTEYNEQPYILDMKVIEEAKEHVLNKYPIHCPVRLIHGMKDRDVPYHVSLDLVDRLGSVDIQLTLVKDGEHRLSDAKNLQLITKTLVNLIDEVKLS